MRSAVPHPPEYPSDMSTTPPSLARLQPVKIRAITSAALTGESPKGGWSAEIKPQDSIHALVAVHTDAGITGYGSVFTDARLVQAALKVLEPLFLGENALEPERVSEKLHQNTFWMGRGGSLTHAISGIDIALWDILGKATGLPVGRLLGGSYRQRVQPYCSLLMEHPKEMFDVITTYRQLGFTAFKIGWGPFGRAMDHKLDAAIVHAARDAAGPDARLMVDAGASDDGWTCALVRFGVIGIERSSHCVVETVGGTAHGRIAQFQVVDGLGPGARVRERGGAGRAARTDANRPGLDDGGSTVAQVNEQGRGGGRRVLRQHGNGKHAIGWCL